MIARSGSPFRRRLVTCFALIVLAAETQACSLPHGEALLSPAEVSNQLERALYVRFAKVPNIGDSAAFPDVEATYVGTTISERMLILVFRSTKAGVQVLGKQTPRLSGISALRYRNVVVLYQHIPGTISRAPRLAAALRKVATG